MLRIWKTTFLVATVLAGMATANDPRAMERLRECIKMAEPLVHNPEYIFPLRNQEIRSVCRMWDGFVDCVNEYTGTYLSATQKQEFNLAIRSSIESIKELCGGEPEYHRSYLAYAPCIKRVSIDVGFCGGQYHYLADLAQGTSASDAQLCCAHHKFRDCVLDKTPLECDKEGIASGTSIPASRFTRDMLDRALGFLLRKCRDFVPNARDCPRTSISNPSGTTNNGGGGLFDNFGHGSDSSNNNNNNNNNNDNSIGLGNNQYLRPDSTTTSRPVSSTPFKSTTRFTWTTKGSGTVTPRPTSSSVNLAGNGLLEPESQQFRGGASGTIAEMTSVLVALAVATILRLQ